MAQHYKDVETKEAGIRVHVTWTDNEARKPIVLRAYAIDAHNTRVDGSKTKKVVARTKAEIEFKIMQLRERVMKDLRLHSETSGVKRKREKTSAESHLASVIDYIEQHELEVSDNWGERYQRSNLIYFRNHIVPFLSDRMDDWDEDEDVEALQKRIVDSILKKKRSSGHSDTAMKTAEKYLTAADTIYQYLTSIDQSLPKLSLHPSGLGRGGQPEQLKSIPPQVRHKLAQRIVELVEEDPKMAVGAVLMYDAGLRPGEAAAVLPGQVVHSPSVTYVTVFYQAVDGKREPYLKTSNSYRLVPLTEWGKRLVCAAFDKLQLDPEETDKPLCNPDKLSKWLKKSLIELGVTDERVTGYVVRRDWASRVHAVCGLTTEEIDYLMGHDRKLPKRRMQEFRTEEGMAQIAMKMERYIIDPTVSKHPACTPYQVKHSMDVELLPYESIRMVNSTETTLRLEIDAMALISSEPLSIVAPSYSKKYCRPRPRSTRGYLAVSRVIGQQPIFKIKEDGTVEQQAVEETSK